MANKRNLSSFWIAVCRKTMVILFAPFLVIAPIQTNAQVPPRSEAAQEQREEKSPPKPSEILQHSDLFDYYTMKMSSAQIRFSQEPLSIVFRADDGKESTILFTEDGVTYSGDVTTDESAKMFFNLFWKKYILEEHLKAKCEGVVGQREE